MADRVHGVPAPPTTSAIEFADWDSEDLSGRVYERVAFHEVDLTESTGDGAVFVECTFRSARFNASTYTDSAFLNCTFTNSSFFDATFTRCKFVGSMFDRCTFDLLKVKGGDWSLTGLPGAPLGSASFVDVRMREADLTGARCGGATLRDVDLSGALLHSADFTRADLRGSDLSTLDPLVVRLGRARVDITQAVAIATALGLNVDP
ncbi:pentapeptide repeat-containing protein [Streptosporangium sp. NPDC020145]|uniref:pentapeptide repeat-containing protein n=1 Tax=Streptosporangium sp. NPDC020145 TaxID=3154694 RepID=UPI003447CACF